jgi:hypothetical protein
VWVALHPDGGDPTVATADTPASVSFTAIDAMTALGPAGAAKRFRVRLRGAGHLGVDYAFQLPGADSGTVANSSIFYFFEGDGGCSATGIPVGAHAARPGEEVGPFAGAVPGSTAIFDQDWCVAMVWDREGAAGYENTAEVTGTAEDGADVTASDSWDVKFRPETPADDPDFPIVLRPDFIRPT